MLGAAVALAALLVPVHVEPQSSEAPAGARTTFGFVVEHGCDGSPTVQVSIQVPDGAFDIVPLAPEGWTGQLDDSVTPAVVRYAGGPLPADVEAVFSMELVTPNRPGEVVAFPTRQVCEVGDISWISLEAGAAEPAPRIVLTENPDPILPTTTTATTGTTTSISDTSDAATPTTRPRTDDGDDDDEDDGSPVGLLATIAVGVVAVAAGIAAAVRRRR